MENSNKIANAILLLHQSSNTIVFRAVARLQNKTRQVSSTEHIPQENFEKCSSKHFPWHFSLEKSILGKCRSSFLLLSDTDAKLMAICILMHSKLLQHVL